MVDENASLSETAHYRRALRVTTPAFARHLCFFVHHGEVEENDKSYRERRSKAVRKVFEALKVLKDRLASDQVQHASFFADSDPRDLTHLLKDQKEDFEHFEKVIPGVGNGGASDPLHASITLWIGLYLGFHLRAMFHETSEYISLTLIIDDHFDSLAQYENTVDGFTSADALNDSITPYKMTKEIEDRLIAVGAGASIQTGNHRTAFYEALWDQLDSYLDGSPFRFEKNNRDLPLFMDFRGAVMCADPQGATPLGADAPPHTEDGRTVPEFLNDGLRMRARPADCIAYLNAYQPFFLSFLGMKHDGSLSALNEGSDRLESNVVLCEVLKGDAIFGSAIKALPSDTSTRPPGPEATVDNPLLYFVIYSGVSRDQLGRLIRRIHTLTELRFAALIDHEKIKRLSGPLRRVGQQLDAFLGKAGTSHGRSLKEGQAILAAYGKLSKGEETSPILGGAPYRINRSIYYMEAFTSRMADLRVRRIRGWQEYDRFITRYLDQHFQAIRSTKARYGDLTTRIEKLENVLQTLETERTNIVLFFISVITFFLTVAQVTDMLANAYSLEPEQKQPLLIGLFSLTAIISGIIWASWRKTSLSLFVFGIVTLAAVTVFIGKMMGWFL